MHISRVAVRENHMFNGIDMMFFSYEVGGHYIYDFKEIKKTRLIENESPNVSPVRFSDAGLRLMYEELRKYYGDNHDITTLRRDYDAERARVDKFIDYTIVNQARRTS